MSEYMKIGDLAKAAGVTVRTLHHYHQIGLLVPSRLSDGGHRLYGQQEIRKLYHIAALKDFGFSLEEISDMVNQSILSPLDIVDIQLEKVSSELKTLELLHGKLLEVKQALIHNKTSSVHEMIEIIELLHMNSKQFLTEEQLARLKGFYASYPAEEMEQLKAEWIVFIETLKRCKDYDLPASSEAMQWVVDYWQRLNNKMSYENPDILEAVHRYHAQNYNHLMSYGLTAELFAYLSQAIKSVK